MKIKFLTEPALLIDDILVIADLHLGFEYELSELGIIIPSQLEKFKVRLNNLIKQTKAKHLVILGDMKHQVPGISWQEFREIPEFFRDLNIKISIVKGNHDGDIERLVPQDVDIYDSAGFVLNKILFTHGQAWPHPEIVNTEYLIMGHIHPAIEFWTENVRSSERCWLRCEIDNKKVKEKYQKEAGLKEGIIVPTFNHLLGGVSFNSKRFKPSGPLLQKEILKWKDARIYLLDGTFLGNLNNIKKY